MQLQQVRSPIPETPLKGIQIAAAMVMFHA
jgi:hypothetical protein